MSRRGAKKDTKAAELTREGTMVGTAMEGEAFLAKTGGVGESRREKADEPAAAAPAEKEAGSTKGKKAGVSKKKEEKKPSLKKSSTMAGTALEGADFVARVERKAKEAGKRKKDDKTISEEANRLVAELEKKAEVGGNDKKRKRLTALERAALEGAQFLSKTTKRTKRND